MRYALRIIALAVALAGLPLFGSPETAVAGAALLAGAAYVLVLPRLARPESPVAR